MADLIPETIKSQSARDELNKRTSNLPSFGGVAKSFGEPLCLFLTAQSHQVAAADCPDYHLAKHKISNANSHAAHYVGNEFGETTPQEVGSEVAKNTPDVDLTKNPKELGEQAGDAVKDAGKEVAKQNPLNFITMLDLPSPQVEASLCIASL